MINDTEAIIFRALMAWRRRVPGAEHVRFVLPPPKFRISKSDIAVYEDKPQHIGEVYRNGENLEISWNGRKIIVDSEWEQR